MAISSKNDTSYISTFSDGGIAFVGLDATKLYAAATLKISLESYGKRRILMSRVHTPTNLLQAATRLTGKTYKRGQHLKAAEDVNQWCLAMHAALPVVEG